MKKVTYHECDICSEKYYSEEQAIKCEEKHKLTERVIAEFIEKVKSQYSDIKIQWEYFERENCYDISHNVKPDVEDYEFNCFIGGLIEEKFFDNDIFNAYVSYDMDMEELC